LLPLLLCTQAFALSATPKLKLKPFAQTSALGLCAPPSELSPKLAKQQPTALPWQIQSAGNALTTRAKGRQRRDERAELAKSVRWLATRSAQLVCVSSRLLAVRPADKQPLGLAIVSHNLLLLVVLQSGRVRQ